MSILQRIAPGGLLGDIADVAQRQRGGLGGALGQLDTGAGNLPTPQPGDSIWIRIGNVNPSFLGGNVGGAAYSWEFASRRDLSIFTLSEKSGSITRLPAFEMNDFSNVPPGSVVRAWYGTDSGRPALEFVYDQSDCCVGGGGGSGGCSGLCSGPPCIAILIKDWTGYTTIAYAWNASGPPLPGGGAACLYQTTWSTPNDSGTVFLGNPEVNGFLSCTVLQISGQDGGGTGTYLSDSQNWHWPFPDACAPLPTMTYGGNKPPQIISICPSNNCPITGLGGGGTGGGTGGGGVRPVCIPCNPAVDNPCYKCRDGSFCSNVDACFGGGTGVGGLRSPVGGTGAGILGGPLGGSLGQPVSYNSGTSPSSGGCSGGCGCGGTCGGGTSAGVRPNPVAAALPTAVFGTPLGGSLDNTRPVTVDTEALATSAAANNVLIGDGSGGVTSATINSIITGVPTTIIKATDESTASDTTLSNDSALTFTMAANKNYSIRLKVFFDLGAAAGADGFKYALTGPASPTLVRVQRRDFSPGALSPTDYATDTAYTSSTALTASSTSGGWVEMDLIVQNGANSGTFAFQWAQNSSNVANTTVRAGSSLSYLAA